MARQKRFRITRRDNSRTYQQYMSNARIVRNEIVGAVDDSRPIVVYPSPSSMNLTVAQGVTVSNVRPSSVGQSRR